MATFQLAVYCAFVSACLVGLYSAQQPSCYDRRYGTVDGNSTVAFLFSFHDFNVTANECSDNIPDLESIQLLEAAVWALKKYSTESSQVFGLKAWDTCTSSARATEQTVTYLGSRDWCPTPTLNRVPVVIGSLESGGQAEAVAKLLTDVRVPLISFAATQQTLTTDDSFSYFTRTTLNDGFIADALVKLLKRQGWTYVNTVSAYTTEDEGALQAFADAAARAAICISLSVRISGDATDGIVDGIVRDLIASPANIVVVFTSSTDLRRFVSAVSRGGSGSRLNLVMAPQASRSIASGDLALSGSLGFRLPPPETEDEFDKYFKALIPSSVDAAENPWFDEYWQRKYMCTIVGTDDIAECSKVQEEAHRNGYQRHPYTSAVIDAVQTYLLALNNDSAGEMEGILSRIRNVNFTKPNGRDFTFTSTGDLSYNTLELVKYNLSANGRLAVINVGSFDSLNSLTLQSPLLNDIQSACTEPCNDPKCIAAASDDGPMVYIQGDVILAGLFAVHSQNDSLCGSLDVSGIKRLEAMLYALDKLNNDSSVLAGIRLGVDGFDTCGDPDRAGHQILRLVSRGNFGRSGSGERNTGSFLEHIYGVIGPNGDDEAQIVNGVLNVNSVPMISYAASASSLSNTLTYKNFARTVSSDSFIGIAMVDMVFGLGWKYIQLLNSNTAVGRSVLSSFRFNGRRKGICLTSSQTIPSADSAAEMDNIFTTLAVRPDAKAIVIVATNRDLRAILTEFKVRNLFGQFYLMVALNSSLDASLLVDFADIAPGMVFISAVKRTYPDFQSYFSKLNPATNLRNPWFAEYWSERFKCSLPGAQSDLPQECQGNETLTSEDGVDDRVAQTVDAVYAMARAISTLQLRYCPGETRACPDMIAASGEELFQIIGSRNSYFNSVNDNYLIQISSTGDVRPEYDLLNVQLVAGSLVPVKIGGYLNFAYDNQGPVKLYSKEGENYVEIVDTTTVCTGLCTDCLSVDKGLAAQVPGGDVWIGGLFELHEPTPDGLQCQADLITYNVQLLESFLFAIERVNANPAILPELKLGGVGFDTCGSGSRAKREVLNFVSGTVEYRTGFHTDRASVVGIIGGETSDTSVAVAEAITPLGTNQISYAATSTELSDRSRYPNFLRTVPADNQQSLALVDLLKGMVWSYVSIVYSDNEYGTDLRDAFLAISSDRDICVAMSLKLEAGMDAADYARAVDQLGANPHARVVLLLTSDVDTRRVLEAAEGASVSNLQWIGTDTWGSRRYVSEDAPTTARGALVLRFKPSRATPEFEDYFAKLLPYSNNRNPWWREFYEDSLECNLFGTTKYTRSCPWPYLLPVYEQETEASFILDAVEIFATGLHNAMVEECPGVTRYICDKLATHPEVLNRHLRQANLSRPDGSFFQLGASGEGKPAYDIVNIHPNESDSNNTFVQVGSWISGKLEINSSSLRFYSGQVELLPTDIPSLCRGRCAECGRTQPPERTLRLPGELQLVGLFDIHSSGDLTTECSTDVRERGVAYLEAMLYAVEAVNADPELLTGVRLGATVFDTCQRGHRGVGGLASVFNHAQSNNVSIQQWSVLAGVIGGETNNVTFDTAPVAQEYEYVQVSYGVGATDPNLDNLLRTAPSIGDQMEAVIRLSVEYFGWKYISVVASSSAHRLEQLDALLAAVGRYNICVGLQERIGQPGGSTFPELLQRVYAKDPNVVILLTDENDTLSLMEAAQPLPIMRRLTWILAYPSDGVRGALQSLPRPSPFEGSLVVGLDVNDNPQVAAFIDYFKTLTVSTNRGNPWFGEYVGQKGNCSSPTANNPSCDWLAQYKNDVQHVIDSVYAVAHGVQDLLTKHCGRGGGGGGGGRSRGLCGHFVRLAPGDVQRGIKETRFTRLNEPAPVQFTSNGILQQNFAAWNLQAPFLPVKIATWRQNDAPLDVSPALFLNETGNVTTSPIASVCLWGEPCSAMCPSATVVPTDATPTTGRSTPPQETTPATAATAAVTRTPMASPTRPTPPPQTTPKEGPTVPIIGPGMRPNAVWFIVLTIISVIGILLSLVMIAALVCKWRQLVACSMSPFLYLMVLVGVILMFLLAPVYEASPNHAICTLQRLWPGLAFAFCQCSILLMSIRLYRVAKTKRHSQIMDTVPTLADTSSQIILFVVLLSIEVVILVEWLVLQPPHVVVDNSVCAYSTSSIAASFAYIYFLLLLAIVVLGATWSMRNAVSMMDFTTLLLMVIGSIVLFVVWILIEELASEGFSREGMALVTTVKAILILALFAPRLKDWLSRSNAYADNGHLGISFAQEYPHGETGPINEIDDRGSQIELTDAATL